MWVQRTEDAFRHDVELFDHLLQFDEPIGQPLSNPFDPNYWTEFHLQNERRDRYSTWIRAACRDGALNLSGFVKSIKYSINNFKKIPPYQSTDISKKLTFISNLLDESFPDYKGIRDASAHVAEFAQAEPKKHSIVGPQTLTGVSIAEGASVLYLDALAGRTFTSSYMGKPVSLEMSQATLSRLEAVRLALFTIFGPLRD